MKSQPWIVLVACSVGMGACGGGDDSLFEQGAGATSGSAGSTAGSGGSQQDAGSDTSAGGNDSGAGGAGGTSKGGNGGTGAASGNGGSGGTAGAGNGGTAGTGIGGTGGTSCGAGLTWCSDECVDINSDPRHCGGCGKGCDTGQVCNAQICTTVEDCTKTPCTGFTWCNTSTKKCEPGCSNSQQCSGNHQCDVGSHQCVCAPGLHECGGSCVSDASPGSCGQSCIPCPSDANGQSTCVAGSCGMVCNAGYHVCGLACASDSSPQSCGSSCQPCPKDPNGTATCNGGTCGIECNPGARKCGPTCVPCPSQGVATTQCSGATCVADTCSPGYWKCGNDCCTFATENVDTVGGNWMDYDIAVEGGGVPHVAWLASDGLHYGKKQGASWAKQSVDAAAYRHVSIALTPASSPWIAYQSYAASAFSLKVARMETGFVIDNVDNPGCCSSSTTLAISSAGTGYIAFNADYSNNGGDVRTYGRPATTWVYHSAYGYPTQWTQFDTAADSGGLQHVAYADSYSGIVELTWNGTSYNALPVDAGTKAASVHYSIKGAARGIVYCGSVAGVQFAQYASSTWSHEAVSAGGSYNCDVAVDSAGDAHVVFVANGKIVYAKRSSGWTLMPFADADDLTAAISVDAAKKPHILYSKGKTLYYAH